jgi:hypothetical protein
MPLSKERISLTQHDRLLDDMVEAANELLGLSSFRLKEAKTVRWMFSAAA